MYSDIKKRCIVRRLVKQASASRLVKLARAAAALQNLRMMEKQADPWELRNPRVGGLYSGNRMNRWIKEKGMSRDQFERRGGKWRFKGGGGPQPPAGGSGGPLALRDSGGQLALRDSGGPLALRGGGGGPMASVSSGGPLSRQVNLRQLPPSDIIDAEFTYSNPRASVSPKALPQARVPRQLPAPQGQTLSTLDDYIRNYTGRAKPGASGGMLGRFGRAALGAARRHPIGAALAAAGLGGAALYGGYKWLKGRGGSGRDVMAATPPTPEEATPPVSAPAPVEEPSYEGPALGGTPDAIQPGSMAAMFGYRNYPGEVGPAFKDVNSYEFEGPAATKREYARTMSDAAADVYGLSWKNLSDDQKKALRDRYYKTQASEYDNNNAKNWYVPNFMQDQYKMEGQVMLDDGNPAPFKLQPQDDPDVHPEPEPAPAPAPTPAPKPAPNSVTSLLNSPEMVNRRSAYAAQQAQARKQQEQAPPPEPEPEPQAPPQEAPQGRGQTTSRGGSFTRYPGRPGVNAANKFRVNHGMAPRVPVFQPFGSVQEPY